MKVLLVPSTVTCPDQDANQFLTSYVIDDAVAIDAGSLGLYGDAEDQARVRHVFLSHTHADHIATLPIFVENAYEGRRDCLTIHGGADVLDCLRRHVFNDRIWPDFERLSPPDAPFFRMAELVPFRPVEVDRLRITPIPVDHVVPTYGFVIEGPGASVVVASDTGPTEAIWRRANATPDLKAVFLEAAFPDAMAELAAASKHLCPARFAAEVAKLDRPVPVYAVHLKSRFRDRILRELEALGLPDLRIAHCGAAYQF